jgi:glycosyltransferase involved in cell wall biosynthesis
VLAPETLFEAAHAIAQDATLAEVVAELHEDGIRPLLVRGPAVARWLYDDPAERPYGDVDLLVAPGSYGAAGEALARLGFEDRSAGLRIDEHHPNESHWVRVRDRHVCVDLHHSLSLVAVAPAIAWARLTAGSGRLAIAGIEIDIPSPAAHLVVLALHAAHHGVEQPKPLADLAHAKDRVPFATWQDAAALATELGAGGAMREGLKLVEGGRELADALELADDATRLVRLHARTPPPTSSGIERLLRTRGTRARLVLIVGRFFPSPAYLRQWKPLAQRGRWGLALAYLWRPLWLLWHAPGGAIAWVAAALPRERRARIPAFLAGGVWALRAWLRCRFQLRRGGLHAVELPRPPADLPGAANGVARALNAAPATCLERSLVRQHWYAAHGRARDVVIGIRGPTSDFGAHAWLDGDAEGPGTFTELQRWPAPAHLRPSVPLRGTATLRPLPVAPPEPLADRQAIDAVGPQLDPACVGEVAIVHDYLNQRGGAEKVVLELAEIWPQAPIYTSLYRPESTFAGFRECDVRTSALDHLPVDKRFRNLFPLYPAAFRSFGKIDGDVVIASSSGWAHLANVTPRALRVVYCHTPARWLYRSDSLSAGGQRSWRQTLIQPAAGGLRALDQRAARRAHLYIANSREVQRRIRDTYGIDALVVYPPVDTKRLTPRPRGERLLVISRLLPYKRVDLVVRAAQQLGIGLDVVGDGPMLNVLRGIAGPDVTFHRAVQDRVVVELLEGCRAVCVAGEEDFGIVAVEAQAAGKPVVAYARGGALETVQEGVTGVFFEEQTEDDVAAAIAASEDLGTPPAVIASYARRFGRAAFRQNLLAAISDRLGGSR